jgi:hypothetical protein
LISFVATTMTIIAGASLPSYITNNTDRPVQAGAAIPVYVTNTVEIADSSTYLHTGSNLSDLNDAAAARTNLGLVSGGSGDIWVQRAGSLMTGALEIDVATATSRGLILKSTDDNATTPLYEARTSAGVAVVSHRTALSGNSITENFLNVTNTLPSSSSATVFGINFQITGSGSSSSQQTAAQTNFAAGYTGSGRTIAGSFTNSNAGTNTLLTQGNNAINASMSAQTTGMNISISATAAGSSLTNIAIFGSCIGSSNTPPVNIGVFGRAVNGTATNIGGYFVTGQGNAPSTSAGLIANNGSLTTPIFLGTDNGTSVFEILDGGLVNIKNGALATDGTTNFLNITGTLPATPSATVVGTLITITSAGSAAQQQRALGVVLTSGFTGSSSTLAINATNAAAGTSTATITAGNIALSGSVTSATAGNNTAVLGSVQGSSVLNVGVHGSSITTNGTNNNVGVIGRALNTGGTMIGGLFWLSSGSAPTYESAALIADNGAQTVSILIARNNGTKVWQVINGGHTQWGEGINAILGTTTGTQWGTAANQKQSFWGATPIVQPTTGVAAATFTANVGTPVVDTSTFDGYTLGQIAKALRNAGLLA